MCGEFKAMSAKILGLSSLTLGTHGESIDSDLWIPISTETLGSAGEFASVTIPAGYDELEIQLINIDSNRSGTTSDSIKMEFNGDTTATNYRNQRAYILDSGTLADTVTDDPWVCLLSTADSSPVNRATWIINVTGISDPDAETISYSRGGGATVIGHYVHLWKSTATVTSVKFTVNVGNANADSVLVVRGRKTVSVGVSDAVSNALAWDVVSSPDAAQTAQVGKMTAWDTSTLTADRNFTLPATADVDDPPPRVHLTEPVGGAHLDPVTAALESVGQVGPP